MQKYYALIEGANFKSNIDGKKVDIGFFANFQFEGDFKDNDELLFRIQNILKIRIDKDKKTIAETSCSFFIVREIDLLEEFSESSAFEEGFSIFSLTKSAIFILCLEFLIKRILVALRVLDGYKRPIIFRY